MNYYENKSFFKKKNNKKIKNNFNLNAYFDHRGGDHFLDNYNNKLSSIFAKLPYSLKYLFDVINKIGYHSIFLVEKRSKRSFFKLQIWV